MSRDVELGPPLSEPLGGNEFRWRPYGYLERRFVTDPADKSRNIPGPVTMALLSPDLEADTVARREGGRWVVRHSWREALDPSIIRKTWTLIGIATVVLTAAILFLVTVERLGGAWPLIVSVAAGLAIGALVQIIGQDITEKRAAETRAHEDFAVLWLTLTEDGYAEMARQFDQVAEAWTRGRVLDQSWEEVRLAVVEAATEYAEHRTPADKANPEWMRAMKILDDVRTHLGLQGLG